VHKFLSFMGFLWDGEVGWGRPTAAILSLSFMVLQPSPHWAMWSDGTLSIAPRRRYNQQHLQTPGNRMNIMSTMIKYLPKTRLNLHLTAFELIHASTAETYKFFACSNARYQLNATDYGYRYIVLLHHYIASQYKILMRKTNSWHIYKCVFVQIK